MELNVLERSPFFIDETTDAISRELLGRNVAIFSKDEFESMSAEQLREVINTAFQYVAVNCEPSGFDKPITAVDLGNHHSIEEATAYYNREVHGVDNRSSRLATNIFPLFEQGVGAMSLLEYLNEQYKAASATGSWSAR